MEEKKVMIPKPLGDIEPKKNNNLNNEYMKELKEEIKRREVADKLAKTYPKNMKFREELERKKRRR